MKFSITLEIDSQAYHKATLINDLSNKLESYFAEKSYGEGIQNYLVGCICIKTQPGYEDWNKKRKPRYKDVRKVKLPDKEVELVEVKEYTYDIKIDNELYDEFIAASETESLRIIFELLKESLSNLDKLPKKVKDFDSECFKEDFLAFFELEGIASPVS